MRHVYTRLLLDEQLRVHLEQGHALIFSGAVKDWLQIERQVERLGFGEEYAVSGAAKTGTTGARHHTRVSPLHNPMGL